MNVFEVTKGDSPLILAMPHTGIYVPDAIAENLNEEGRMLRDTDWHIEKLYDGLVPQATIVRALFHRYVIDANRAPSDESLYPGQNTTGLCPTTDFDGNKIYLSGREPQKEEIENRRTNFHAPYHRALDREIRRIHDQFGVVVLYDCHSIRSLIPYLFEGKLPDFNIGTNQGVTCAKQMESRVMGICSGANGYSTALNGRFKGGWTTRNYGQPEENIHAIQMELSQSAYLQSKVVPFDYSPEKAAGIRPHLKDILEDLTRQALEISKKG
ncbi:MAG: N-formylglutamate deformylase [Hyphomicrobiales bacterium]|nr:N-formylglutamate deformylase [Hyphomicrobiales bacterium]